MFGCSSNACDDSKVGEALQGSGAKGGGEWVKVVERHELMTDIEIRSSKYLNNLIEQDHRNIKSRTKVMLGFKRFRSAATTISGIKLMHRIRKGQFNLATLAIVERILKPLLEGTQVDSIEAWNKRIQQQLHLFGRYGVTMFAISGVRVM